jgi:hypothetical protein
MIIPSNIFLNEKDKEVFETFIQNNQTKIKAILVYLDIRPFHSNQDFKEYYKYIAHLTNKYKLIPIGFFNESLQSKFSDNLKEQITLFKKDFGFFLKMQIKTIIRPYRWYHFNFFEYDIKFYIPRDSIIDIIRRTNDKELFFSHLNYLEKGIEKIDKKSTKQTSIYAKRISIAHPDSSSFGDTFYKAICNASDTIRDEIDDIYFGKDFIYDDGKKFVRYSNVMNVSASDEQIEYLFLIQKQFGISISLTLNQIIPPKDILFDKKVLSQFLEFIGFYYKKGLRVITISDVHLVKTGIIQKNFPELKIKNTVNHKIADAQTFINFALLGYHYIQLDRSLTRDINELKKIARVNKKYNKKLYLLSGEYCMYNCPYKDEHDSLNHELMSASEYFVGEQKLSGISCDNWRMGQYSKLPRNGVDLILNNKADLDEYLEYVDVLKFSGRLVNLDNKKDEELGLYFDDKDSLESKAKVGFKNRMKINHQAIKSPHPKEYDTKEGMSLIELLKTCKNQCYDCHVCEKVFKVEEFDSLIGIHGNF